MLITKSMLAKFKDPANAASFKARTTGKGVITDGTCYVVTKLSICEHLVKTEKWQYC